jgi:hypothetical protein
MNPSVLLLLAAAIGSRDHFYKWRMQGVKNDRVFTKSVMLPASASIHQLPLRHQSSQLNPS